MNGIDRCDFIGTVPSVNSTSNVGGGRGGEVYCQTFFFCCVFPVQQTTSGTDHRRIYSSINSFFGLATHSLDVRNKLRRSRRVLISFVIYLVD